MCVEFCYLSPIFLKNSIMLLFQHSLDNRNHWVLKIWIWLVRLIHYKSTYTCFNPSRCQFFFPQSIKKTYELCHLNQYFIIERDDIYSLLWKLDLEHSTKHFLDDAITTYILILIFMIYAWLESLFHHDLLICCQSILTHCELIK